MNIKAIIPKKTFLFCILFLLISKLMVAQQKSNDFWDNVLFGGGIGLSFGDGFFSGTLAPSAIYEFNDFVALGFGLNGTISNRKHIYKSNILGGSLISLFNVIPELQFSAEFEELHIHRTYDSALSIPDDNYWSPALFLGAGYRTGNVTFGIRYDILYDNDKSIYADPWAPFVRFYF